MESSEFAGETIYYTESGSKSESHPIFRWSIMTCGLLIVL
jgi:hypothetical protein